jgi:hypothetical protein
MKEKPRLSLVPDPEVQPVYRQLRDIPSERLDDLPCANYSPLRLRFNRCICVVVLGHDYELLGGIFVNRYICRYCAHELTR